MLLRARHYPQTFFCSLAFHKSLSCVKTASPKRTRIPQHLALPRLQNCYSLLPHDRKMMEVDEEQSPNSGSADSSRSESPATASTPSPMIEVEETVSILPIDKAQNGKQKASNKSKYVPLVSDIIKPRAYQREMLGQSLRRNVIVAVSTFGHRYFESYRLTVIRWIRAAERHKCMFIAECSGIETLTEHYSAVLRIQAELERCSPDKVRGSMNKPMAGR